MIKSLYYDMLSNLSSTQIVQYLTSEYIGAATRIKTIQGCDAIRAGMSPN